MDERRGAQRLAVPKPVPCTFGGYESKIVEISLIGCQIQHTDRVPPKARLALKFRWRGKDIRLEATVVRSEMRSVGGKPAYQSGVEFCRTPEESPAVVKEIVDWLAKASGPGVVPASSPASPSPPPEGRPEAGTTPDEDVEALSADYLQCVFANGAWTKLYVDSAAQPADGFTIPAPSTDAEADVLCRAYERADAAKRRAMRAQFELTIRQQQQRRA